MRSSLRYLNYFSGIYSDISSKTRPNIYEIRVDIVFDQPISFRSSKHCSGGFWMDNQGNPYGRILDYLAITIHRKNAMDPSILSGRIMGL